MLTNSKCNCNCTCNCTGIAIFAGIIAGIIAGILYYATVITSTAAIAYAAFGVAVLGIIIAFLCASARIAGVQRCICNNLPLLLIGVAGAFISAIIISSVTLNAGTVISAVLIGITVLFTILTLSAIICAIICISGCNACNTNN